MDEEIPLTQEQARAQLWSMGELSWKLYEDQLPVYEQVRAFLDDPATAFEVFYLDISRQWGKTFLGADVATECAIRHPGWDIRYVSYTKEGLREFVHPNFRTILRDCPPWLSPQWLRQEAKYLFPNGSSVHMAGANNGHEDDSRGPKANLIIVEEAAFVDRLQYLVSSVLTPQLSTTAGRILMISTPPISPAHEVSEYKELAQAKGHYARRTINDNKHMSDGAKAKLISVLGGPLATACRRELYCEWVVDEERAVIPEFTNERRDVIVQPVAPPTYERPIVAIDVGFEDLTAVLFGYWHFASARLHIQREVLLRRARTDQVAEAITTVEKELWGSNQNLLPTVRWSDTDLRLIADLGELHHLGVMPTAKDDKEAQVNAFRMLVQQDKLRIDPSCPMLIGTLRVAVWNKARTQFEQLKEYGHADALDAAIYMHRNVGRYENPYPGIPEGATWQTHQLRNIQTPAHHEAEAIKRLMGAARRS